MEGTANFSDRGHYFTVAMNNDAEEEVNTRFFSKGLVNVFYFFIAVILMVIFGIFAKKRERQELTGAKRKLSIAADAVYIVGLACVGITAAIKSTVMYTPVHSAEYCDLYVKSHYFFRDNALHASFFALWLRQRSCYVTDGFKIVTSPTSRVIQRVSLFLVLLMAIALPPLFAFTLHFRRTPELGCRVSDYGIPLEVHFILPPVARLVSHAMIIQLSLLPLRRRFLIPENGPLRGGLKPQFDVLVRVLYAGITLVALDSLMWLSQATFLRGSLISQVTSLGTLLLCVVITQMSHADWRKRFWPFDVTVRCRRNNAPTEVHEI